MSYVVTRGMGHAAMAGWVLAFAMTANLLWADELSRGTATSTGEIKPASVEKAAFPAPKKSIQEALLRLHNSARARQGLLPFKENPRLTAAAQRFAEYIHRTGRFSHYADGRSPDQRIAAEGYGTASWAENIAWSQTTPEGAMTTWMNSGGHRGNILSGHVQVGFGNVGTVWVTVFANPANDPG